MADESRKELERKLDALRAKVDDLQEGVRLATHHDRIEDLTTTLTVLPQRLAESRSRGYVFEKALEGKLDDLSIRWPDLRERALSQVEQEARHLGRELRSVERQMQQVSARSSAPPVVQSLLPSTQSAVKSLEEQVRAASGTIEGMYDQLEEQVGKLESRLRQVDWVLDRFSEATFQLLPSEAAVAAVDARWDRGGKDDPVGIIYLTDQRLLYEQKQEVATKKVLFITREKKTVQELLLEVPVGAVESVRASRKGFLGHEDHIDIDFAADADVSTAHFHLDGQDCEEWQARIGRAKAGDFDRDRAVEMDLDLVERARSAPTRCTVCNAPITQRILRGMDRVECAYCGHVLRL